MNEESPPKIRLLDTDKDLPRHVLTGFMHYDDFEPLTEGGAATLQTCLDKNLMRVVAIKRLHPHLKSDEMEQRRFLREARVTAQIAHPSTVPVYELGRDDVGDMYFTMKRLAGRDLRNILQDIQGKDSDTVREYPLARLLEIFVQAGNAVAFAHSQGVVHRDLKPANILVGGFGEVMVLDWGLAKVYGEPDDFANTDSGSDPTNLHLTQAGKRYGTPLYMSPEQAEGEIDVDERCDVYNLGLILYEMLTLHNVVWGTEIEEVLRQIKEDPPIPPRRKTPQRNIPPELEAICLKALAKRPADRYANVLDLLNDIRNYQAERPVSVFHDHLLRRFLKWRHRHMLSTTSILFFLLGILLTLLWKAL